MAEPLGVRKELEELRVRMVEDEKATWDWSKSALLEEYIEILDAILEKMPDYVR